MGEEAGRLKISGTFKSGCIPALNYRTISELRKAILLVKDNCKGPLGINLIVNKFNTKMKKQLEQFNNFGNINNMIKYMPKIKNISNAQIDGKKVKWLANNNNTLML